MAEAGKVPLSLGLTGGEATEWPLQRYARCIPSNTRDPPGPRQEAGTAPCPTWKEGFSLVGSKDWLKIVRRMDCLLFGTTIKDKSRLFRVQFSGESKEQALEHCCSCVQKLAQYITVQVPDGNIQELQLIPGPPRASGSQGKDSAKSVPWQAGSHQHSEQQVRVTAGTGAPDGRTSLTQLAQTLLASEELPRVYEQSAWGAEELGPFLRLCLMDQNFPAFVEEVEKELKKLAGLRN
ncbi:meiotic recombination protein REC114 isoform X3 [Macaca fascicularis]|uniref:meiotic recombination protein REC114 isoform X3 n=1 Tax=Macaca fascicularis TaxID=9541 RepID=UPI001E2561AD|nr:meiotic recombination protein REC114 isoform X4 [Macaca fascicularis]